MMRTFGFVLTIGVFAAALGACANGPPGDPPGAADIQPRIVEALPPQRLGPGRCGVFLFEQRAPNRFVFFEDETSRRVKIVHDGAIVETGVSPQTAAFVAGEEIRRVYLAQDENLVFTLTGRIGEETGSGLRIEDALLRTRRLDGTEIVLPVGGVRNCRPANPVAG